MKPFLGGLIGGSVVGLIAYYFVQASTRNAVKQELATGTQSVSREVRTQVEAQVRPAVDTQIRATFDSYGITPQLMRSVTNAANRLLG
jgi:hypothetical protein